MSKRSPGPVVGLVGTGAGGVENLRLGLVAPALERGWRVAVTLTPTAASWLRPLGEVDRLERVTGLPVRVEARSSGEASPHPEADCYVVAPATSNTVAKLATGIADNPACTQVCEAIGAREIPVVVFPRVNAAHAGHPAWMGHINVLRSAGVRLVYGEDVWPLHPPRGAPSRSLPWNAILDAVAAALGRPLSSVKPR